MSRKQRLGPSMARIGRLIHSTLSFDETMERVIAEAGRAVGSETAAMSLRQGDHWIVRCVHGFPREVIGARMDDAQEPHAVLAIKTKKPVVIDDAFTDERVNREHMKQWGVRSVLVVPLVTEEQALGVLSFNRHQAKVPFTKSHVEFAGQLASSLSLAVRKARLLEDLRGELAEREKAEQALRQLNAELEERVAARTAELSQANDVVRAERQRFHDVLETLPAYLVLLTPDHHVPFANRFFRERFGASQGKRCFEYLFGRTEPCEVCETYKVLQTMTPLEWEWTGPDGRDYYIYDFPFTGVDGSPLIMEVGLDITERKLAQTLESIQDGFFTVDRDWRFAYVNPQAAANVGLKPEELVGKNLWERFPQIIGTPHEISYRRAMEARQVQRFEMGGVLTRRWYSITAYPSEEGLSVYWQDITERKRTEEALCRTTERFKLLSETTAGLLVAENPQEFINELCRKVMEHLDCQVFFNSLVDEGAGRLHLNACAGIPQQEVRKVEWLDFGQAVCGCVARDGARIVAEEILTTRDPRTDLVASFGIQAYACHPLIAQGKVIGILSFGTKTRTHFSAEDLSLMKTVADQVAVALDHVRAREALRRAHEELQVRSEELTVANEELRVQSLQLQESEQRLRMALEGGQMGRWEWDLVTDSMFWSERTFALLGLDTFMRAGVETLLNCVHSEDRAGVKQLIARVINEAKDFQAEFRVLHHREAPRGTVVWLALHAQVLRDEHQQAVRTIGVMYDITPRKQMEAELRRLNEKLEEEVEVQTEELRDSINRLQDEIVRRVRTEGKLRKSSRLLEAFFKHTLTPLAFLDRSFVFVRVNEAFAQAAGKPAPYFVHKSHFALYPSAEDRVIFEQVVQSRQPYQAFARPFPYFDQPQQPTRYWNWRLTPLLDDKDQVQFLVFNLEDVTEQQKAFGELEHRAGLLQKMTLELSQAEDRERRRLAEILHDDLQQVLAAAKFHLGLLKSRLPDDEQTKELADQLTRMLKESIEKSRSLSHELSPAVLYQGDLGETFEWLARQIQTKHGLTVHTEVHGKIDTSSEPIKAFLFRAAQEILFNTVKHAHVSEARLRLQRRHGRLWLTIADQGRGFDPRTLGRTTGFGLFSVRERVELLGGRMKIHSARNKGSVIVIAMADEIEGQKTEDRGQKAQEDAILRPPLSVLRSPSSGGPLRILLADDHKTMRAGLAALIAEQADMKVVGQAGDGRKAVALAHELLPDVVIMDVAMPMMPGDEATRQIKAILPHVRIIALSMFEEQGVAQRMHDAGAEVYLPKTGPSEGLLAAIRGTR